MRKGMLFALAAAVISGFSIYINKYAVMQMSDPFIFTTVKNIAVAFLLLGLVSLPKAIAELKTLSGRQWLALGAIGAIGGSVPFLLFFHGLTMANAASAALIQKTLFIWVAIMAVPLLGEKLGRLQIAALVTLVAGNVLLLGLPKAWSFGAGEAMVLIATLLWAVEAVIARKAMRSISSHAAAFGRMSFGAVIMIAYLAVTGKAAGIMSLSGIQIGWVAVTAVVLLGYVSSYYAGLKHAPASAVTSVLVLGSVITSLLYAVFDARRFSVEQVIGMAAITVAALAFFYLAPGMAVKKGASPVLTEK